MCPAAITAEMPDSMVGHCTTSFFDELRSVRWRVNLGVLPSSLNSTIDELRRVTADSRRRYASLRRRLLIDPHISKSGNDSPDPVTDNPLSQNPDSTWGHFFRTAELEQMLDKDLSRLYPEHGSYFQTPACQGLLRRILLLWCLRHPECGYRQGMHELLAPLIYVLHADIQHLSNIRKLYGDHFVDKFDDALLNESLGYNNFNISKFPEDNANSFQEKSKEHSNSTPLDANLQNIVSLCDPYGADGELGIVLSEKFMEHDAYSLFDALMNGSGGDVAMAKFFSHSPPNATHTGLPGLPPVIEASMSVYHLLSIVDPSLYSHLIELGVEPQYFALRWLRVLFGREFTLEDLLVIWDEIFSFENSKSTTPEHDPAISSSPRGAFISAMAVSMMLHVRSSLLAAELATSCLQRLLNFPEHVDLVKLVAKAKSLMHRALDANVKQLEAKEQKTPTPVNVVPERYWEEKWRLMQKEEEETKKGKVVQQQKRGWTEKIKSRLSRTESDSSISKRESRDRGKRPSSVRRSLIEDLSLHLNDEKDVEEDPLRVSPEPPNLGSPDEHSPLFSEPTSPVEIDSEKSSILSNVSNDIADGGTQSSSFQSTTEESLLPSSDEVSSVVSPKDRKSISGKFQWLWKFVRNNSGEGTSGRKIEAENGKEASVNENTESDDSAVVHDNSETSTCNAVATVQENEAETFFEVDDRNKAETSVGEDGKSDDSNAETSVIENAKSDDSTAETSTSKANIQYAELKTDGCDQNLVSALRNLGQSMLENIQVVESAMGSESSQPGAEVTAIATTALNELRKISNLLRDV